MPTVSLIMPAWRPREDWLRESVASALAQSGCTFELIVVDDGNEPPIAPMLGDSVDERMRLVRIAHGGTSAARNAGTEVARGRFIRYIDCDDVLTPDGTAQMLAEAGDDLIVHAWTALCDPDLRPQSVLGFDHEGHVVEAALTAEFDPRHFAMLFPARVVAAAGPWDTELPVSQDWDFVIRCLEQAEVRPCPIIVSHYRQHASSASSGDRPGAWAAGVHAHRRVIEKYLERHPDRRRSPAVRRAWTWYYVRVTHLAISTADRGLYVRGTAGLFRRSPVRGVGAALGGIALLVRHGRGALSRSRRRLVSRATFRSR